MVKTIHMTCIVQSECFILYDIETPGLQIWFGSNYFVFKGNVINKFTNFRKYYLEQGCANLLACRLLEI